MTFSRKAAIAAIALLAAGAAAGASPFDELVATERAFAAQGAKDGVRTSFLAYMADDALVYRPGPVSAKAFYEKRPDSKGKLLWGPRYALPSGAGDLGVTTGPWQFVDPAQGDKVVATGWFFSVWRRGADGKLHWVIDHGIDAPDQSLATEASPLGAPDKRAKPISAPEHDARLNALLAAERGLSDARTGDAALRLSQALETESICLLSGTPPDRGCTQTPADKLGFDRPRTLAAVHLAASGDLAATSGYGPGEKPDSDVRVWRWRDGWRLVAVVMVPGG